MDANNSFDALRLLGAIVDSSDDAIISKNLDSIITSWNKSAERMFGYSASEAIGQSVIMLIPAGRLDEEPAILERIRAGDKIEHYETVRRAKDGSPVEVSLTVSPIRDTEGKIVGASKIARDITAQRQIQERLRRNEELYRVTLASIGDAVIASDDRTLVTYMNSVAEGLTGWTSKEAIGAPLDQVFRIVDRGTKQPIECPAEKVLKDGVYTRLSKQAVLLSKVGREYPIEETSAPIREAKTGKVTGVVVVFRDTTEKRASELMALRLAAIVSGSEDAIVGKNLDGVITNWNSAAERILGYSASEIIGKPITVLIPPERQGEEREILARLRSGKRVEHFETIRVTKDGREIDVSLSISPIKDDAGQIVGASKILRDVSDRKEVERKLQDAQRQLQVRADDLENKVRHRTARLQEMVAELETFSYSVSHDLREPMRAIQQYADILKADYGSFLDEQGRTYLERISSSISRLDALIWDVLAYSRVLHDDLVLHPVDTERLLEELIDQYPNFQPPNALIEIVRPLLSVRGNPAFLTQCLTNLIGNAVKFVVPYQTPRVKIMTEKLDLKVRIWVEDNGIGIAPNDQARIFRVFERINPQDQFEGSGIGLSIVRKAVERMNGRLGVESEVGKGSRFWIELDAA